MALDPLNRLCKWRSVLSGWHHGTRSMQQPGTKAMRDLMDKWLVMRCECNALAAMLIHRGICTEQEFTDMVEYEATLLNKRLEETFPGFKTSDDGIVIHDMALAQATMQRLGFPP